MCRYFSDKYRFLSIFWETLNLLLQDSKWVFFEILKFHRVFNCWHFLDAWTCTFGQYVIFSECFFDKSLEQILLVLQRFFSCYFDILKSIWFSNHLCIQKTEFSSVKSWKISKILEKSSNFFFFLFPFIIGCKMFSERFSTINQSKCCHFAF